MHVMTYAHTDPRVWGPDVWRALHYIALGYPDDPSPDQQAAYRAFFTALGPVLPCASCATNYQQHLRDLPVEPALQKGGRALFEWTVALHNLVNQHSRRGDGTARRPLTPDAVMVHLLLEKDQGSILHPSRLRTLGVGAIIGMMGGVVAAYVWCRVVARRRG